MAQNFEGPRAATGSLKSRPSSPAAPANAVEGYKASMNGDGLRILDHLPEIIRRGADSLTAAEKELLKWVGVFYRRPTPGRFMMRIRMPNGFVRSDQLRTIAELSRRLGNGVVDITTRQQIELRGFLLDSIPAIWDKLGGVDLRSLQTGIDNVRNITGCVLAGLTPHELFDASPVVQELDRIIVGSKGNPEFTNLPRKFNITVTGCLDNCTHNESQDIALVPAKKGERLGFNVLVGGKMGSGGFTIASHLNVFVEAYQAAAVVVELIKIYRDHGPREARSRCRFAFLLEKWGVPRLRAELTTHMGYELAFRGREMRSSQHADHIGLTSQKQPGFVAVGVSLYRLAESTPNSSTNSRFWRKPMATARSASRRGRTLSFRMSRQIVWRRSRTSLCSGNSRRARLPFCAVWWPASEPIIATWLSSKPSVALSSFPEPFTKRWARARNR